MSDYQVIIFHIWEYNDKFITLLQEIFNKNP